MKGAGGEYCKRLSRVVDLYHGANEESWLVVYEDGGIKRHKENDG